MEIDEKQGQERKKILFFITKSNWGGAQRHVFDLAVNLDREKFDVLVVAGGNGPLHQKLKERGVRTDSIKFMQRDINFLKELVSFFRFFKILKKERPNIIHLHSPKAGGVGALASRLFSCLYHFKKDTRHQKPKIIYTAHGWPFKEQRKTAEKGLIYFFSFITVLLADHVITVSEDDFKKTPILLKSNIKKIHLIKNGIPSLEFLSREDARKIIFSNISTNQDDIILGSISELHRNKGLSFAIEALSDTPITEIKTNRKIIYTIISDGEERKNLERIITEKKLENNVFLLGAIDEAYKYLKAFDVFVFPSLKEGLPYGVLEAGMAGIPIIASRTGGIPEIITDMENGLLVPPRDTRGLSLAIRFFIQNPEKIAEFGERVKQKVKKDFSLQTMLKKTVMIYEDNK